MSYECKGGAEVACDNYNGLVLHEADTEWHRESHDSGSAS